MFSWPVAQFNSVFIIFLFISFQQGLCDLHAHAGAALPDFPSFHHVLMLRCHLQALQEDPSPQGKRATVFSVNASWRSAPLLFLTSRSCRVGISFTFHCKTGCRRHFSENYNRQFGVFWQVFICLRLSVCLPSFCLSFCGQVFSPP